MGIISRDKFMAPITQRYSISGFNKKQLIVGIGNITEVYAKNRHNLGFMVIDKLAEDCGAGWNLKKDLKSEVAITSVKKQEVILAKPQTYMNSSGQAVRALMDFYKLSPEDITIVYDEIDIPFGEIRVKVGGSDAGHNGIKSVITHIGDGFRRIRIGVGPKTPSEMDLADFVLQDFSKSEAKKLPEIIERAIEAISAK